ncbi:hypothetical protein PS623_04506 [Pseudomonas fluorescens]|nr:hypothetical protein PS623_04506 [Pseudomonas fluorescens]
MRRIAQLEVERQVGVTFLRRHSCYSNGRSVDGVFDSDRGGCASQVYSHEVTAVHLGDSCGDFTWINVDVSAVGIWYQQGTFTRRIDIDGVIGATDVNGDRGGAAGLRWIAQLEVEGEIRITFFRWLSRDYNSGGLDNVFDSYCSRSSGEVNGLKITAPHFSDGRGHLARVDVCVGGVGVGHQQGAFAGCVYINGVDRATNVNGQASGTARLRRIAQLEVEGEVGITLLSWLGSNSHRRGVDGVLDSNSGGRAGQIDGFEVATVHSSDGCSDFAAVFVNVFNVGVRHLKGALAIGTNADGVVSATDVDGQRRGAAGLRRVAQLEVEGEIRVTLFRRLGSNSHGRGVDGVLDSNSGGRASQVDGFEVAAVHSSDGCSDFAAVFVNVFNVGVRHLKSALAIGANADGVVSATDVDGQRRGAAGLRRVAQLEVEGEIRVTLLRWLGSNSHGRGVDRVLDSNRGGRASQINGFKVTAIDRSDSCSDFAAVFVNVFNVGVRHLKGALAIGTNADGVVSATDVHGQRRGAAGLRRVAQLEVEGEIRVTLLRRLGSNSHGRGVDGVLDSNSGGRASQVDGFEVATVHSSDGCSDFAAVFVNVFNVGVWHQQGAFTRSIDINGVVSATNVNGESRGAAGLRRVAQLEVEGEVGIAFLCWHRGHGNSRGVDSVFDSDSGGRARQVDGLEVATIYAGHSCGDRRRIDVDIAAVGIGDHQRAFTAGINGNGVVGTAHVHGQGGRATGLGRVAQLEVEGEVRVAFLRRLGGHRYRCGVNGVDDLGDRRGWVRHNDQTTTGGAGDGDGNLAAVDVRGIVRRDRDIDRAGGLACTDDDDLAIGESNGQVGQRRLANGRGVNDDATRLGDRRRSRQCHPGGNRRGHRRSYGRISRGAIVDIGIDSAWLQVGGKRLEADRASRETNSRVDRACSLLKHHKGVTAASRAAITGCSRARRRCFKLGGRVGASGDGLLQFFDRGRCLCGSLAQIGTAVRSVRTPLRVAAQVEHAAIGQLQSYRATWAGQDLLARHQTVAFNQNATKALWGYRDDLANNAFDDGNNTAHWTLRI